MTQKSEIGEFGENAAAEYLVDKGYKIIERNHRQKWGELDIIALSPRRQRLDPLGRSRALVFVEVKTVSGENPTITAENQMTSQKIKKTKRTAYLYANANKELSQSGWQVDMIAVNVVGGRPHIKHYENI